MFLTDARRDRGVGRLRVRARPGGQVFFYFRYTPTDGERRSIPIGVYDQHGREGLTLKRARDEAGKLSRRYQAGEHDLHAHIEQERAEERTRLEEEARARREAERQAKAGTLQALMDGYLEHLKRQGKKTSARDAKNLFRFNVTDAAAELAALQANKVTHEDISGILAKVVNRGAGRTAGKLRAYLRAAYAEALAADSDPTAHPDLRGFNLTANPAAIVPAKPLSRFNRAGQRTLNATELRAFINAVDKLPAGLNRDALMLNLYLGGQRLAQLMRARPADADLDEPSLTLFDSKGARKQPRPHRLPLTDRALEIVERRVNDARAGETPDPYLFTNTGTVPVSVDTLSGVVSGISKAMVIGKTAREPFGLRDIRRTCETMLAAMGISKDLRAQVQSHGLGGVQDRHYDRHEYMDEKRRALEAWKARLQEIASGAKRKNVVELSRKQA